MSSRTKLILLAAALAAFPLTAAATYIVTDLGTLSGTYSEGHSINDSGQVVGNSSTSVGNRAFLYSGGGRTNLGTLPSGSASNALAINKSGQVAGWSYTSGTIFPRAFLYSEGEMTSLGTLYPGGGGTSVATGINDPGQVVGYTTDATNTQKAFLYTDRNMVNLGTLPGGSPPISSS